MIGDAAKTEDAILLRRYVKSGAEDAFTELVTRHLALVFSSALRQVQGDRHVAEDISQAVFTELAHQAARLTSHPTLAGWLYTTTRRITAHALRGDRRRE